MGRTQYVVRANSFSLCHCRTLSNPVCRLIYQLLDYERALRGGSPTDSFGPSEDEEWERRRRLLDEEPDQESTEVLKEAKALDEEMEERRARKASHGSLASVGSNTNSFTGAVGNGAPWRSRFGHAGFALASQRTRAGSIGSTYTSRSSISVLSEDPVEEEEEEEEDTFGNGKKVTTPSTDATDDDAHRGQIIVVRGELERPAFKLPPVPATPARLAKLKMDAAAAGSLRRHRQQGVPSIFLQSPHLRQRTNTFKISLPDAVPPSAPFHRQSFGQSETVVPVPVAGLKKKEKRRPPPLLGVPAVIRTSKYKSYPRVLLLKTQLRFLLSAPSRLRTLLHPRQLSRSLPPHQHPPKFHRLPAASHSSLLRFASPSRQQRPLQHLRAPWALRLSRPRLCSCSRPLQKAEVERLPAR
jgi:hypothetical protein